MATRNLVVGSEDASPHLTVRGPPWHADSCFQSPGSNALLTIIDAEHGLGGISGYDAKETQDEVPERLGVVQRMTWAYLRSALYGDDHAWRQAADVMQHHAELQAALEVR